MSVRKYIVQGEQGIHEYTLEVEVIEPYHTKYSLYASHDSIWTDHIKGEILFSLTDDGNGVKLEKKLKYMDYCEAVYMRALLNMRAFIDGAQASPKLKVVEIIEVTTI